MTRRILVPQGRSNRIGRFVLWSTQAFIALIGGFSFAACVKASVFLLSHSHASQAQVLQATFPPEVAVFGAVLSFLVFRMIRHQ